MSYNISKFITRFINLRFPDDLDTLLYPTSTDFEVEVERDDADGSWSIELGEATSLEGVVEDGQVIITGIKMRGEFSGRLYHDFLLPIFREFKGSLDALVVWEGGDTIEHLLIIDGSESERDVRSAYLEREIL